MALATSGTMSIGGSTANRSINVEFGRSATATTSMSQLYRGGGIITTNNTSVPTSGAISISNFYGAINRVPISYTFSENAANVSINISSLPGYIAGVSDITITVNPGVYIYSTSTGTPALSLTGGTASDTLTLVNKGYIMGQGGTGGVSYGNAGSTAGGGGGYGIFMGHNLILDNSYASAYIGGGGGGGGATDVGGNGGGGAGGGAGGSFGTSLYAGGAGGGLGGTGGNGNGSQSSGGYGGGAGGGGGNFVFKAPSSGSGGGGGRIFPGVGGAGGSGGGTGAGGSANNSGQSATYGAGGGGWGASGGSGGNSGGGAGGRAIFLNSYSIQYINGTSTARIYGAIA